jgi:tRNA pseudouridine65 synthase
MGAEALGPKVRILVDAGSWLAVDKPPGLRSHPNKAGLDPQCVIVWPYDPAEECFKNPRPSAISKEVQGAPAVGDNEDQRLHLLHRLDAPTSGVLVLARNAAVAEEARKSFAGHQVRKVYYALVKGAHPGLRQQWKDLLGTERVAGQLRSRIGRGTPALCTATAVRVIRGARPLTLLRLEPETGRTHHLRVQCAHRGLPIVGDATYGDFHLNRHFQKEWGLKRLCLHAESIDIPLQKMRLQATSPLPEIFNRVG